VGDECLRWEPLLSALVDGEATSEQLADLRPHLRNCGTCRATLRALHTTGTSLGALFPPTTVTLGATDLEHAGSLLTRLYETVSMTIHERAASTVLRLHTAVETATAHKAAAIAASAVAVAGGGLAVDEARRPEPARAVAERSMPSRPASVTRPPAKVVRPARGSATGAPKPRTRQRTSVRPTSPTPVSAAPRSVGEPLVDPVESRTTTAPAHVVARPASTLSQPDPTKPPSPARTSSSEFGFEKP
jgi:hypothetical protein